MMHNKRRGGGEEEGVKVDKWRHAEAIRAAAKGKLKVLIPISGISEWGVLSRYLCFVIDWECFLFSLFLFKQFQLILSPFSRLFVFKM